MASATIPKAPPIASAHEARNQYRKGYLIIGQKGSCHEKGADQLASCLKRIAVNQPNRASDDRVLIKTHAGQCLVGSFAWDHCDSQCADAQQEHPNSQPLALNGG